LTIIEPRTTFKPHSNSNWGLHSNPQEELDQLLGSTDRTHVTKHQVEDKNTDHIVVNDYIKGKILSDTLLLTCGKFLSYKKWKNRTHKNSPLGLLYASISLEWMTNHHAEIHHLALTTPCPDVEAHLNNPGESKIFTRKP
jgi:hypothetical protein